MAGSITLYSFGDNDRSGKVRWTAEELGYQVEEMRVELGDQHKPEYLKLNPYAQIPAALIDGQPYYESMAICLALAACKQRSTPCLPKAV